jgi:cytochrome c oxidase subunit 2
MMNFEVRVVSAADFKTYLQARISGKTNAEALQSINQPPLAVTTHPFDTRRGQQVIPPAQASSQASDSQAIK